MNKALQKTGLRCRFTEHDLRAKVASDAPFSYASRLMGHSSPEITERIYRRKAQRIVPFVKPRH
jgi:integrase